MDSLYQVGRTKGAGYQTDIRKTEKNEIGKGDPPQRATWCCCDGLL